MKQGIFTIVSNEALTDVVYKMVLEGDTSAITNCGQFVDLRLPEKYLRRPISVCDYDETTLTLIYKVVGEGTQIMAGLPSGTQLDVLTGLGNGYDTTLSGDMPVLVGGGVGVGSGEGVGSGDGVGVGRGVDSGTGVGSTAEEKSRLCVCWPAAPSTERPFAFWKALTALIVPP